MPFIVKESAAHMPMRCWTGKGRYRKIAVLEVEDGVEDVKMISKRAKGVKEIVKIWDRKYETKERGPNCAASRARAEAEQMAHYLNKFWPIAKVWCGLEN